MNQPSQKYTGNFETASGDYDRSLELEYMKTRPPSEHGIGYTILPGDIEPLEYWARFFRAHGQDDRETFMRKRIAMGLHYMVPCKNPDDFERHLRASAAIRPREEPRPKYRRQEEPQAQVDHETRERLYQMMKKVAAGMGGDIDVKK